jgi:signal transduction histidine kinase
VRSIQALAADLVSSLEPREIVLRLVERALDIVPADRCTLTSLDEKVLRVEASFDRGRGRPAWLGREYPYEFISQQPLLKRAVDTGEIATGGGFTAATPDPDVTPDLAGIRHTAVVPLSLGKVVAAVLILSRREDRAFGGEELQALQEIGVLAVLALRSARLFEEVNEAQERGLQALSLISEHLAASDELPAFFGKMSASVAQLVHAEKAAFWMFHEGRMMAQAEAHGFDSALLTRMDVRVDSDGRLSRILHEGEAISGEITPEALAGPYGDVLRLMSVRDVVVVPWQTADLPLGVLLAGNSRSGFSAQDQWVMRVAARASAVVWQGYEAERRLVAMQARERKNLEQHATRMAELEQLKSQFLRLASHELRTPLTIVRGYVSMFQEGVFGDMSEEAMRVLPTISSRVAQMNLLIDQMLNAARLEDSRLILSPREVRVDEVVDRVISSLQGLGVSGQKLLVDNPWGAVVAFADPEKTETIVANLVSNAIKYSPRGGDVVCEIEASDDEVVVTVVDDGVGIAAEDMPRLFQRFGRLERPETANIEGTGLGLFLSRELAHLMDGDITVESTVGRGSRFTLTLPARDREPPMTALATTQ